MEQNADQRIPQLAIEWGLTLPEYERIVDRLGRQPNYLELWAFAILWSDQSSRKNSRYWLQNLPERSRGIIPAGGLFQSPLVNLGDGWACSLLLRSSAAAHSTTAIQEAAVESTWAACSSMFTQGITPKGINHCFSFRQEEESGEADWAVPAFEAGSAFGNLLGIAHHGTQLTVQPAFQQALFSTLMVGLVESTEMKVESVTAVGYPVFMFGTPSAFQEINTIKKPAEPKADRFPETDRINSLMTKVLMDFTLEATEKGLLIGVNDLRGAGVIGAVTRLCRQKGLGLRLQLDRLGMQEVDQPEALAGFLAPTSELLIGICPFGKENDFQRILEKWDLEGLILGEMLEKKSVELFFTEKALFQVPVDLIDPERGTPVYQKEYKKPKYIDKSARFNSRGVPTPKDYLSVAEQIIQKLAVVNRTDFQEWYDGTVGTDNLGQRHQTDAALSRVKNTDKAIAVTLAINPEYLHAEPYQGAMITVAQAARKIVCSGAEPAAISCGFYFGYPEDAHLYYAFVQAVKGANDGSRKFNLVVTDTDCLFDPKPDQHAKVKSHYPILLVAALGVLEQTDWQTPKGFQRIGSQIYMIGTPQNDLGSSVYLRAVHTIKASSIPVFDLDEEYHIQQHLFRIIRKGMIESAHSIGAGGLFTALLECAMVQDNGFEIETDGNFRKDAYLFGESQSRAVVTVPVHQEDELVNYLNSHNVPFSRLGEVTGGELVIDEEDFGSVADWKKWYQGPSTRDYSAEEKTTDV